jgi:hypothetical protein
VFLSLAKTEETWHAADIFMTSLREKPLTVFKDSSYELYLLFDTDVLVLHSGLQASCLDGKLSKQPLIDHTFIAARCDTSKISKQ